LRKNFHEKIPGAHAHQQRSSFVAAKGDEVPNSSAVVPLSLFFIEGNPAHPLNIAKGAAPPLTTLWEATTVAYSICAYVFNEFKRKACPTRLPSTIGSQRLDWCPKMKTRSVVLTIVLLGPFLLPAASQKESYTPREGFVPDEKTAIRISEAVLTPIYGEKQIKSEEPFSAKLHNGIWTVTGTIEEGVEGGVAEIKISKRTGTIISVTHGM